MPLHPDVQAMRAKRLADAAVPLYLMSVAEARDADLASIRSAAGSPEAVDRVEDRTIPGRAAAIPIRLYRPTAGGDPLPVLVYFFGGGWVLGSLDTSDGVCRTLANASGCAVVSVGYRLAPEHPFPAAVDDCFDAVRWLADNGAEVGVDPRRIAVGGDSAGANLAAVVALLARDAGGPALRAQALVYPNTDRYADTPSRRENTDPAFFNNRSVEWYWNHYLATPRDATDWRASPLRATDHKGLPPALIVTAEHDPLRDEGEEYAQRLCDSGVDVEAVRYDGMVHGFFTMTGTLDAARDAVARFAGFVRAATGA